MGELTISPGAVKNLPGLEESVAIVVNGDTAPKAITSGQYLFIKNHSVLATGGYHATAAIASGEDVTSSNVAADANGVVNAVYNSLNSKFAISRLTITRTENIYCNDTQLQRCRVYKRSGWYSIVINLQTSAKSATSDFTEIGRISNYNAYFECYLTIPAQETLDKEIVLTITTGGIIKLYAPHGTAGDFYRGTTSIPIDD